MDPVAEKIRVMLHANGGQHPQKKDSTVWSGIEGGSRRTSLKLSRTGDE